MLFRRTLILFIVGISALLSACGNKGALYLPEPPAASKPADTEQENSNPSEKEEQE